MTNDETRGWRGSPWLVSVTVVTSLVYFVLAIRFGWRIAAHDLYPQTAWYFIGALATTVVLYAIGLAIAVHERHRSGSLIPVLGAALFGSMLCVLFYGP